MRLIYQICLWIITACFLAALLNLLRVITDLFGPWLVIRIALLLVLNGIWYIIKIQKTDKTDRVTSKKVICNVIIPTSFSLLVFFVLGLGFFHSVDGKVAYLCDRCSVSPFEYSGLGWQDNCPRVFKGVEGKTGLIDEETICFSLTAPAGFVDDVCSVLVRIKPKRGWTILGIGTKASQPEKLFWDPTKKIESPKLHQYRIKELLCGDTILFICSLRQLSKGWLIPGIKDALSLSFKMVACPKRGEGGE